MLILGIDPGLNITGYGLIETRNNGFQLLKNGFIKTHAAEGLPKRLAKIHARVCELLDAHKPEAIVLEKLYSHYKHPVTAALLGHARGVICVAAEQKNVPFFEYSATRVKKIITGSGHASKIQMQKMIEHMFGAKRETLGPADTTDAISLAITHAYTLKVYSRRNG